MRLLAFTPSDGFLLAWGIFLLVVVVVIVPTLLVLLLRLITVAAKINANANAAAAAAKEIRANSEPAAQLAETLRIAGELLEVARTVEAHGVVLERVLTRNLPQQAARR
ncbi:MAG: hypothetical protein JO287_02260 [Pseudonocardiales bacterium]|nr:hypothetical protein [Pseudonocardiales bacterium]